MANPEIANLNQVDVGSDSSEEEFDDDFIMYKDRPEWSDMKPLPQDDGPFGVVSIKYTPQFSDTFNYFRAVMECDEISERALVLTGDCIKLNPSNYTVWHYRRILLEKLGKNLEDELEYTNKIIMKNSKNYQVWEHQKFLLKTLRDKIIKSEIMHPNLDEITRSFKQYINQVLKCMDHKNYHAWQQRQWFLKYFNRFDGELDFSDEMIKDDLRNNSAWNHRFYVISNTTGFTEEVIDRECQYTVEKIKSLSDNESSMNYLLGIINISKKDIDSFKWIMKVCDELYAIFPHLRSPHLVYFMYKFSCMQLDKIVLDESNKKENEEKFQEIYLKAKNYCQELSNIDSIRQNYWKYRAEQLQTIYAP